MTVSILPNVRHAQHTKVYINLSMVHARVFILFFFFLYFHSMCSFINSNTDWYNNNQCQEFLWQKMFSEHVQVLQWKMKSHTRMDKNWLSKNRIRLQRHSHIYKRVFKRNNPHIYAHTQHTVNLFIQHIFMIRWLWFCSWWFWHSDLIHFGVRFFSRFWCVCECVFFFFFVFNSLLLLWNIVCDMKRVNEVI